MKNFQLLILNFYSKPNESIINYLNHLKITKLKIKNWRNV